MTLIMLFIGLISIVRIMLNKFCIIVNVYKLNRIKRFIDSLFNKNMGYPYDIYLIHNKHETKYINTSKRSKEEIENISNYLVDIAEKYENIRIIERENIGEAHGAYRIGYLLNRNLYKYYFFIQEYTVVIRGNFLKEYNDIFTSNNNIGLICPHIGKGHRYPYAIKTSFFCIRNELDLSDWVEPRTRTEVELQEMEFFYTNIKNKGFDCMQLGNGVDHLKYLHDNNSDTIHKPIKNESFII